MKARMNIRSIISIMAIIVLASMFFMNFSFATNTGKILAETVKLREEPNTDSKVLELISSGEKIEIINEENGWYQVKYNKITGYIRSDLVEKEETDAVTTTEETVVDEKNNEEASESETATEVVEQEPKTEKTLELGKYKISENVKIKIIPLISAIEIQEVSKDAEVEVIEILNNWAKIRTSDGKEGWLRTDKLVIEDEKPEQTTTSKMDVTTQTKIMYVNSQTINLREKATTSSEAIKQLTLNTQVTVLSTENGWCHVQVNGVEGYIYENLLSSTKRETSRSGMNTRNTETAVATTQQTTATTTTEVVKEENKVTAETTEVAKVEETKTEETTTTQTTETATTPTVTGNDIVAYAKQYLGYKYVYGGTTTNGFDCSGFVQYVYKHFGISLNRTAADQYSNGRAVSSSELQPGDLVMFGPSGISHVGIYIGGNNFIHAANTSRGVTIDTLASGYYKTYYVGARRIL